MVLSSDAEINLRNTHSDLCNKLNIEFKIADEAWDSFQAIHKNFTLEGDPRHWLGCAIYEACWKSPAVAQNPIQGNCVNFTNLLRHCNLSLAEFFCNIRKWADMSKIPDDFTKRIDYIEKSFAVVYNVFKEFSPLFSKIFRAPELYDSELSKLQRNRRLKTSPCTSLRVFEFCWTLFITIKGEDSHYSNDLVPLYHLLMAICDWAFQNAFLADRRDLLNPDFEGLPEDWTNPSYEVPQEAPCTISHLLTSPEMITEVKYVKEYQFKRSIQHLFDQSILLGKDSEGQSDVLDISVFEMNFKRVANLYESNFINKGDFDERIFLAEFKRKLLEKEQNEIPPSLQCQDSADSSSLEVSQEMVVGKECLTPLTGRRYLGPKDPHSANPSATESISRLNTLLNGRQAAAGEVLLQLFESCARNPIEKVKEIVQRLGDRFVLTYGVDIDITNKRLQQAITLFYKFTENVLQNECLIQSDISAIVEKDVFYECMFACCLEIVIYSYNNRKKFPWILEALHIQPYNFIKVIELIIRSKDKLSRDTIKHLNMIEETILSSLVWKSDSLIFENITMSEKEIPKFEETALPGHLQNEPNQENSTLRNILSSDPKQMQSPGPSATDRFQSPVAQNSVVNRELFPGGASNNSLLQHTHLMIKDGSGTTRVIPIVNNELPKAPVQQTTPKRSDSTTPTKPRRTGGLSIVFRKFYNLAGERMEHLCTHLKITNTETKRKIWTAFEELVRKNYCELMKDRDLDQLLMCAVYMICKLTKLNKNFAEIIKSYRIQPQASSDIYRKVLISSKSTKIVDGVTVDVPESRGDLIQFYNTVIIQAMKKFAQKFVVKGDEANGDILLSPLPASRGQVVHQVFDNIFIKPLESPTLNLGNGKVYNYYFSRSPSKDLKDINKAIKGNGITVKRLLIESENDLPNPKRTNRKVQSLIEERRNQNTE